jgi:putative oxidoreductase
MSNADVASHGEHLRCASLDRTLGIDMNTSSSLLRSERCVSPADYLLVLARIGMASLFLFSGFQKIVMYRDFIGFATAGGVPFATLVTPFVIAAEIIGSLMLIAGWNTRMPAIYFAIFCAILGPWFHQFWNASPEKWQEAIDGFFHHFVMAGGFVFLAVYGPGAISIDARRESP